MNTRSIRQHKKKILVRDNGGIPWVFLVVMLVSGVVGVILGTYMRESSPYADPLTLVRGTVQKSLGEECIVHAPEQLLPPSDWKCDKKI